MQFLTTTLFHSIQICYWTFAA